MNYKAVCWKKLNIDRVVSGILWKNKAWVGSVSSLSVDYSCIDETYVLYVVNNACVTCVFSIPSLSDNHVVIQEVAKRLSSVTGWEFV